MLTVEQKDIAVSIAATSMNIPKRVYDEATAFHNLKPEEKEEAYKQITERLDKYETIYFSNEVNYFTPEPVTDFYDLLYKFFINAYATSCKGKSRQCYGGRRRSIIDLYLLLKHYCEDTYTLEECVNLYFKLDRGLEKQSNDPSVISYYKRNYPNKSEEGIKSLIKSVNSSSINYYCGQVKRNVYVKQGYPISKDELAASVVDCRALNLKANA